MKKVILFIGFACLIIFECLRVYLIMPMPGSQRSNSIELAYFLGSNKNMIRLIGYLIVIYPLINILIKGKRNEKIIAGLVSILYAAIFYVFTFMMEADKMFYQPTKTDLFDITKNKIPTNKLVVGVTMNGVSKAYPIQLIGYHHQVRDTINQTPIMVTRRSSWSISHRSSRACVMSALITLTRRSIPAISSAISRRSIR